MTLVLVRVGVAGSRAVVTLLCLVGEAACFALRVTEDNALTATRVGLNGEPDSACPGDPAVAGLLYQSGGDDDWMLVRRNARFTINGAAPFRVARLEPGALLAVNGQFFAAVTEWSPQPIDAPPELADKRCPVCGGEFWRAPIIQCPCGRWTHLQAPDEPANPDVLNCYFLASPCGVCGRPSDLQPRVVPELPEVLSGRSDDHQW